MTRSSWGRDQKALIVGLIVVGFTLVITVMSYAATTTSTTVTVTTGGIGGEFGFTVGQGTPATTMWTADATTTVTVSSATNFAVGDYILIDSDANGDPSDGTISYHTVTAIDGTTLTVDPDISNAYTTSASVNEPAVYSGAASWTPAIGSVSNVTAGNHFIVNLQGLSTSDTALVEIFLVNTDELVKNYTYLHRVVNVRVLCDSASTCSTGVGIPYESSTAAGDWGQAEDAAGTAINATDDYLTLTNARQAFILIGGYTYSLAIDDGTMFTIDVTTGSGDSLSPTDLVQITAM